MANTFFAVLSTTQPLIPNSTIEYNPYRSGIISNTDEGIYTGIRDPDLISRISKEFEVSVVEANDPNSKSKPAVLCELTHCELTDLGALIEAATQGTDDIDIFVRVVESLPLSDPCFMKPINEEKERQTEIRRLKHRLQQLEALSRKR